MASRSLLYPHRGNWVETVDDGIRVAKKVDRENVGTMFNLCHWAMVDEEKNLEPLLKRAMPHLFCVTINGGDPPAAVKKPGAKWITPLDEGDYDVQRVVRLLRDLGYRGAIGLQCYGIPGDARAHLEAVDGSLAFVVRRQSLRRSKTQRRLGFDPTATPTLEWMPAADRFAGERRRVGRGDESLPGGDGRRWSGVRDGSDPRRDVPDGKP